MNQSYIKDEKRIINYEVDIPEERLDIFHETISLEKPISYYKPQDYKIDYVQILNDENIEYYRIYNKIVNIVKKICEDIYMLQLWNSLSKYNDQVALSHFSSRINSSEKIFSLSFHLVKEQKSK